MKYLQQDSISLIHVLVRPHKENIWFLVSVCLFWLFGFFCECVFACVRAFVCVCVTQLPFTVSFYYGVDAGHVEEET